jgi:hypothetical protein
VLEVSLNPNSTIRILLNNNSIRSTMLLAIFLFLVSCRKDSIKSEGSLCKIDSVRSTDGFSFHFQYNDEKISEIRSYFEGKPLHIITLIYNDGLLIEKSFYFIASKTVTRKYVYQYDNALLSSIIQLNFNSTSNSFVKVKSSAFTYEGKRLLSAKRAFFTPVDTVSGFGIVEYVFSGVGNNATAAQPSDATFISYSYQVTDKINPLRKNYFFLIDPALANASLDILFEPRYLPILMNENYTISCKDELFNNYFTQVRVGTDFNENVLFISFENSAAFAWDFYNKCQ